MMFHLRHSILPLTLISLSLVLFLAIFFSSSSVNAQQKWERKIRYVQAIWRHGDRAPNKKPYEGDIYDDKYWPRGWNQLTLLGMQQMQELGEFFRDRYVGSFLSADFDRKEVSIRSTAVDRAIESAQALLSGMFPPENEKERFDSNLNWQPIPVHSAIDGQPDPMLRPSSFACPHYQKLRKEIREDLEEQLMPKYKDLAKELRPILNIPEDQPIKFRSITELKSIQMEILHNLTQPEWVNKRWPKYGNKSTIELIVELRDKERVAEFNGTDELAKLSGGYLLGDWLKRAKKIANVSGDVDDLRPQKMLLYSAHDGTLLALLSAIRVHNLALKMPPFATCIIMEIHESKEGKFFIELFYRQNRILEPIVIQGCPKNNCPLEKFIEATEKNAIYALDNLYEGCGAPRCVMASDSIRNVSSWPSTILAIFFMLLLFNGIQNSHNKHFFVLMFSGYCNE